MSCFVISPKKNRRLEPWFGRTENSSEPAQRPAPRTVQNLSTRAQPAPRVVLISETRAESASRTLKNLETRAEPAPRALRKPPVRVPNNPQRGPHLPVDGFENQTSETKISIKLVENRPETYFLLKLT